MKLYRFYNTRKEEYGQIFALCQVHADTYDLPEFILLEAVDGKVGDRGCGLCMDRSGKPGLRRKG